MLKRAGLLIMGISFLATGSCLAGGDPDIKAEEVSASTPNGAATSTSGTNSLEQIPLVQALLQQILAAAMLASAMIALTRSKMTSW